MARIYRWHTLNRREDHYDRYGYYTQRRRQVELAANEWRRALIDVSGSNWLLYFKPTAATLDLGNAPAGPITQLFSGHTVSVAKRFPDPTSHQRPNEHARPLQRRPR